MRMLPWRRPLRISLRAYRRFTLYKLRMRGLADIAVVLYHNARSSRGLNRLGFPGDLWLRHGRHQRLPLE